MAFFAGMTFGAYLNKKEKLIIFIAIITWLIATLLDPLLKIKGTVSDYGSSGIVNSILLLLFFLGYFIGRRYD